jgi:hypothetical protein
MSRTGVRKFDPSMFVGAGGKKPGGTTPLNRTNSNLSALTPQALKQQSDSIVKLGKRGKAIHLVRLIQAGSNASNDDRMQVTDEGKAFLESLSGVFGIIAVVGVARKGKCWKRGTTLLRYPTGYPVAVEDIRQGDELMGPDSQPRRVVQLDHGQEIMYRITPHTESPQQAMVVTENHMLVLCIEDAMPWIDPAAPNCIRCWTMDEISGVPQLQVNDYPSNEMACEQLQRMYTGTYARIEWEMNVKNCAKPPS